MILHSLDLAFTERLRLRGISDAHEGAAAQEEKRLDRDIKQILDEEDSYVILLGDQTEAITIKDVRFMAGSTKVDQIEELDSLLNYQLKACVQRFKPLADEGRIIGALLGNHEMKCIETGGFDIHRAFCEELNIKDLGYSCMIRMTLMKNSGDHTKKNVMLYAHHGHGGTGKKAGASINAMEDLAADWDADVFLMGHNHKRHTSKTTSFSMSTNGEPKLIEKDRVFIRTGGYYKTHRVSKRPDYGEKRGYRPSHIGGPPYVDIRLVGRDRNILMTVTE